MKKSRSDKEKIGNVEEPSKSENVTSIEQTGKQTEYNDAMNTFNEEMTADDCIDNIQYMQSSFSNCVTAREGNVEQSVSADSMCPDDIVIEELYVNDWLGLEQLEGTDVIYTEEFYADDWNHNLQPLESPTLKDLDVTTNLIGEMIISDLSDSFEESYDVCYKCETQDSNQHRYYNSFHL